MVREIPRAKLKMRLEELQLEKYHRDGAVVSKRRHPNEDLFNSPIKTTETETITVVDQTFSKSKSFPFHLSWMGH